MDIKTLKKALSHVRNGQFIKVEMETDQANKMLAAIKKEGYYVVKKNTTVVTRTGINYSHIKSVKEKLALENKEAEDIQPISYATPVEGYEKILLQSKKDPNKYYLRLYPTSNNIPKVKYFVNGKETEKEKLKNMGIMQPSYWNTSKEHKSMMVVSIESVKSIY